MWVMHFVNGAQSLNTTLILALLPASVMSPVTRIYASEQSQRLDLMAWVSNLMVALFSFPSP